MKTILQNAPQTTDEQDRLFAELAGFTAPSEPKVQINALQILHQRDTGEISKHTSEAALQDYRKMVVDLQKKADSGKSLSGHEGWSLEDFQSDYRLKCSLLKVSIKQHSLAAHQIVKPLLLEFALKVDDFANGLDLADAQACEKLKIEFVPSNVSALARSAAQKARNRADNHSRFDATSPAKIGAFIL